jgi:hypothetical protein
MSRYPFLFTFLDKIEGNGYLAHVAVHGRLLAVEEDGVWWTYGVNPGSAAASGKSLAEAYAEFRNTVMRVLFDMATEANSDPYAFRSAAQRFFDETNEPTEKEWKDAREEVRAGKVNIEGMRKETNEAPRRLEIKIKQTLTAADNATDPDAAPSVAA